MTENVTLRELEDVPKKLKLKKAPGSVGITSDMLKHLKDRSYTNPSAHLQSELEHWKGANEMEGNLHPTHP